jgi:hypothetical protein
VRGLKVNGAYSAGLLAKQGSPWAKDSIDFILTMNSRADNDELWGVEVEAHVNPKTSAQEEEYVANHHDDKNI